MNKEYEDVFIFYKGKYPSEEDVKTFSLEKCFHLSIVDEMNVMHYYNYAWEQYLKNGPIGPIRESDKNYWVIKF